MDLFSNIMRTDADFGNEVNVNEDKLVKHSSIVMESLGAAVESLDDSLFLTNVLLTIGERHANYGVKPHMFQVSRIHFTN